MWAALRILVAVQEQIWSDRQRNRNNKNKGGLNEMGINGIG